MKPPYFPNRAGELDFHTASSNAPLTLSFGVLLAYLHQSITGIEDPRQASNGTRYRLSDAILAAFSVFFMQCESFLEHQRQMQSRRGKDNAQTLFGLGQIPTMPQIRHWFHWIGIRKACRTGNTGIPFPSEVMRFWAKEAECAVFTFKRHPLVLSTHNPIIPAVRRFYPPYPTEPVPLLSKLDPNARSFQLPG